MSIPAPNPPDAHYLAADEGESLWAFMGDKYTIKVGAKESNGAMGLIEVVVPPLSGPPLHTHKNEDEAFYILDGEFQVVANERELTVESGGFIYLPKGTFHRFRNVGDKHAKLLLLFTPAGFEQYFVDVGLPVEMHPTAPPAEQYPDDVAKSVALGHEKSGLQYYDT
jgi:mannose-6-phosphate isomerase-like protein (cupin superfamily)